MKRSILISTSLGLMAMSIWAPETCCAGPIYDIRFSRDGSVFKQLTNGSPFELKDSGTFGLGSHPENSATYKWFSGASPGELKGRTQADASFVVAQSIGASAESRAIMGLDDFVVTGPGPTVTISYNLHLDGTFVATGNPNSSMNVVSSMEVIAFASTSFDGTAGYFDGTLGFSNRTGSITFGDLSGFTVGNNFSSPQFTVAVNTPFSFELNLFTRAFIGDVGGPGTGESFSDFSNTLSFPNSGPVFNLPNGYTVNSVEGGIVNNRYGSSITAAVPEPASLTLLILGGLGIIGSGWLRRGRAIASSQIWPMPSLVTPT